MTTWFIDVVPFSFFKNIFASCMTFGCDVTAPEWIITIVGPTRPVKVNSRNMSELPAYFVVAFRTSVSTCIRWILLDCMLFIGTRLVCSCLLSPAIVHEKFVTYKFSLWADHSAMHQTVGVYRQWSYRLIIGRLFMYLHVIYSFCCMLLVTVIAYIQAGDVTCTIVCSDV